MKKGFSLIELLLVVIIIGVIAAIALPRFSESKTQSYVATLSSDLRTLSQAMELKAASGDEEYPVCANIATGNVCGDLPNFTPSPQVRMTTETGADVKRGWYGNSRHQKVDSTKNSCINMGDTANSAPGGGFDNAASPGAQYTCTVAY